MPLTSVYGIPYLRAMSTWARRIRDLQAVGLKLSDIGERVGLATGSVGDIASGRSSSPRGEAAVKLHDLHRSLCGDSGHGDEAA